MVRWEAFLRLFIFLIALWLAAIGPSDGEVSIGVNWGTMSTHPLNPNIVVRMLKDNGIKKVKLFDADGWTVNALAKSGIEVVLAIPNLQLSDMAKSYGAAQDWVRENVTRYVHEGVDIRYIAVGNEPFLKSYNGSFLKVTLPAIKNIQNALNEAGHGDKIKATTPLNADVYDSPADNPVPSAGNFRGDIHGLMIEIVNLLHENNAPFMVNIYPFLSLYQNPNFPLDYAFFDGSSSSKNDKNVTYTNVFDANFDTLVWSLMKAGMHNMKIIVGEVGWPTDGDRHATAALAQQFYRGLLNKLSNNKGTPMHPGNIEVYLFGLLDEDSKSVAPGAFERHWGIFQYNGNPKFPMDLSGKGTEKLPVAAKYVEYMPKQWCVFDSSVRHKDKIGDKVNYACSYGDCTALGYGSSCNDLDAEGNYSYAFNMYFQMQDQDVEACKFGGFAKITTVNMSKGSCLFPIQIVSSANKIPTMSLMQILAAFFAPVILSVFL